MFRSSRKTTRLTLSTSVRAVNQITPNVGVLGGGRLDRDRRVPLELIVPDQLSSCGW